MTAPYNPNEDMWKCFRCGSLNDPSEIYWTCFYERENSDITSDAERCQECDRWIEDDVVCPYCGTEQQP